MSDLVTWLTTLGEVLHISLVTFVIPIPSNVSSLMAQRNIICTGATLQEIPSDIDHIIVGGGRAPLRRGVKMIHCHDHVVV